MTNLQSNRIAITQAVITLLDEWQIGANDQITLLSFTDKIKPRQLRHYHEGIPFPESRELDIRIDHLAGIADALRTTYPRNSQMAKFWLNQKNRKFHNRSPLVVMLEEGMDGIEMIRAHLDCAWDWHMDAIKSGGQTQ